MSIQFDSPTFDRFVAKAKAEGIKVSGNMAKRQFKVVGSRGDALYRVVVAKGDMPNTAVCDCQAGANGMACKHAAACLSAVRKAQASQAARTLSQSQRFN